MGFKADTSFLKFLTMGARGVHHTISQLAEIGFQPIELERYCGSNKIWATKVKRLRLPDLLCVRTGLRVEVRAKSALKIKMSDAPANPERVWDAGLRDSDVVAFLACEDSENGPTPVGKATFFTVEALRRSTASSKLGPPKSASEGAERDRTWPATIPSRDGRVVQVTSQKIVVEMFPTGEQPARNQSFLLKGKVPYVCPGDTFKADACFLSGSPTSLADLSLYFPQRYDPITALDSASAVDRYAGVKALRYRSDLAAKARSALESLIKRETEPRVQLEAAGSAAFHGSALGQDMVAEFIWNDDASPELRMEAVLILTELGPGKFTFDLLNAAASDERFLGHEVRQAAVWGLGKAGLKSYESIVRFLADREENIVLHAIAAFGSDTPTEIIERLIKNLLRGDDVVTPAASEALRRIGSGTAIEALARAYDQHPASRNWIIATLGRMPPNLVRTRIEAQELLQKIEPMLIVAPGAHWLLSEDMSINLSFLFKQNI